MFIGHWSASFVAAARPKGPSLPLLFIGAQLIDWGFFGLLLFDIENMRFTPGISAMNPMDLYNMPYTHSLLGACVWGLAFGLLCAWAYRTFTAFLLGALVVISHWFLDYLVHVPDLTIAGQPPKLGLGLWNHPAIEMPLEIGLVLVTAWFWWQRAGRGWRGVLPFAVLILALLGLQWFNWFGPVAPEVTPMTSFMAFAAYGVAALLAWWAEHSRQRLRR